MSMRVATFATSNRLLDASMRLQSRMTEMQLREASGVKSSDYGGLGTQSGTLINLETSLKRASAYATAISEASDRIDAMYSVLGNVTDMLTDFRTQISAALSADGDEDTNSALVATAQSYLEELASTLNSKFEGRYLFSGSLTETAPVDLDGYVADADTESTSYYDGDTLLASVRASSEMTLTYGIGASDSAFEQAIRAFGIIAGATETPDSDRLETAYSLLESALDDTIALQSGISASSSSLERMAAWQSDYKAMLSASISEIKDVDVAEITVRLTTYQTQLEASYAALAKVMSISLQSYL
ncbi:MAG: flagellin [Alphaproteobacteria bacterium]|nr:flagellin [Alphaproteobacteria bacterium]